MRITLSVELPEDLHQAFLQHLRDFDTKHDPDHKGIVTIFALSTGHKMSAEEFVRQARDITPPLPVAMKKEFGK